MKLFTIKGNAMRNFAKVCFFLCFSYLSVNAYAQSAGCIGSTGPGGPCSTGPGGGLSTGPGGGCSTGPGAKTGKIGNAPNPGCKK